jgi:inosose dehydratase
VKVTLTVATGPVTWGVDFADAPENPPWRQVLDEIARSGVTTMELGPVGFLPDDPAALREELGRRGLSAVGSFVFDDLHDGGRREDILATARRVCDTIAGAGGEVLVIIPRPRAPRSGTAGRSSEAPRLDRARWSALIATVDALAALGADAGLRPVFHPHAGTYVEFEDEIERLAGDVEVDLCLDTGHLAYAGMAPEALIRAFGHRLGHVHLKDVRPAVMARVTAGELGFWEAVEAGAFCPIGEGQVDIVAVLKALEAVGYDGFATLEQDRQAGAGAPLDELRRSLAVLARAQAALS